MVQGMVDYTNIGKAIDYYTSYGFKYIEVPWYVDRDITNITCPDRGNVFLTEYGDLVGSAEQSFISMALNKEIGSGRYCAVTPCFRDDQTDDIHMKYFMKVELIILKAGKFDLMYAERDAVLGLCYDFFKSVGCSKLDIVKTEDGKDIENNNIEVGSYGVRRHSDIQWVYGTGIAEPRCSLSLIK